MKCRHGILGPCAACGGEMRQAQMATMTARLVVELCEMHGVDASQLADLLKAKR